MLNKMIPLILLLIGAGAGVGAGVFLRPADTIEEDKAVEIVGEEGGEAHSVIGEIRAEEDEESDYEYVKLHNQLVIPIVSGGRVTALVVMALSIEVPAGKSDFVLLREPKLRDSFLQVLFDHANIGGFDGNFTDTEVLGRLRDALKEVAQKDLGREVVNDVLIIEIARQDY
jgi:hypothetical protein